MPESLTAILTELDIADLLDLLLVAILFFIVISWVRSAQSGSAARRLMALVFSYGLVYLAVDFFELFLVQRVLSVLFFVVLIALVVVFQGDIRRLLDRLGSVGQRRGGGGVAPSSPVHMLTEAAAHMADNRIGALIAIRGSEPWESHLQGGIPLDGKLSRPLLYSIFNPTSPGHDGALLLEGDRITRFAVHLPLARRPPAISRSGGTRHTAALGLAEECDAFVIVVSEERGAISVAENGHLVEVDTAADLGERLGAFWAAKYPSKAGGRRTWWSRRALETASLALGLATMVWFLFVYSADTVFRSYRVPVEVRNLPPTWRLETDQPPSILITLSGSEPEFDRLNPASLAVSFDLSEPQPGSNELSVTSQNLSLPSGLNLVTADPSTVEVDVARQIAVTLPVRVRTTEPLEPGDSLGFSPPTVEVMVPATMEAVPDAISTQTVDLEALAQRGRAEVPLVLPPEVRLARGQDAEVDVRLYRSGGSSNAPATQSFPAPQPP